jgi:hypothetical protein
MEKYENIKKKSVKNKSVKKKSAKKSFNPNRNPGHLGRLNNLHLDRCHN